MQLYCDYCGSIMQVLYQDRLSAILQYIYKVIYRKKCSKCIFYTRIFAYMKKML